MENICVVGAGTWGSALAMLLVNNGHNVTLCATTEDKVELIKKSKDIPNLPGVSYDKRIVITSDLKNAVSDAKVIVFAVASLYTRDMARKMASFVKEGTYIVVVSKGFEKDTLLSLEDVVAQEIPQSVVAILSGPTHAEEVVRMVPSTCVIGTRKKDDAQFLRNIFNAEHFRVYINPDILGVAIGGAVKNVIALAAGVADGLGHGDNTKAALMTRGISEISRLGKAMGADPRTFSGLSGLGDLIATCESIHSRNRKAGYLIGQGKDVETAMDEVGMVVEGVYAAHTILALAEKYHVEMPIVREVNNVLFNGKNASEAIRDLMVRDNIVEIKDLKWED